MNLSLLKLVFPVAVLAWLFLTIICLHGDFLAVAISACVVVTASNVLNFQYWLEQMFELYYSSCIYLLWFCETSVKMFSVNWCTSWKCLNICQSWEKIVVTWFELYIYSQIWIWIIFFWKIHCRGGSWLNRPYKYTQQGRLVIQPPLQKSTTGAADITSRPYRGHCRGGWKHQPPLQRALQGRSENRPYRGTLCRNTLGRAAGAAAPTEALEPPL